jgi:DegV family protein with EDD domain
MTLLTLENTAIVVDSTADLPDEWLARDGIFMVPLTVHFGDETYRDAIDLTKDEFFAKLATSAVLPTTAQPTPAEFADCYREATEKYEHVFSLHISQKLSGTFRAAEVAAAGFPSVEAYDTKTAALGVGMLVERLRVRLAQGISLEDARAYIQYYSDNGTILILPGTLEYLRRGGRIGRAQSMVGGVLGILPLIYLVDGELVPYAKVRGARKAMAAMMQFFAERTSAEAKIFVSIIHAAAPETVEPLRQALLATRPQTEIVVVGQVGAVVGTHIGHGTSAFAMIVE